MATGVKLWHTNKWMRLVSAETRRQIVLNFEDGITVLMSRVSNTTVSEAYLVYLLLSQRQWPRLLTRGPLVIHSIS